MSRNLIGWHTKMLRTFHKIITGLIIALGLLHVTVTFYDYHSFSVEALWFAGTGVAIVLAGFLNLVLSRDVGRDKLVRSLCVITNIIFAAMFATALFVLAQPQVFLGLGLFAAATVISLTVNRAKSVNSNL